VLEPDVVVYLVDQIDLGVSVDVGKADVGADEGVVLLIDQGIVVPVEGAGARLG
jgi:hypothetical protein